MSTIEDLKKFRTYDLKEDIVHNEKYGMSLTVGELRKILSNQNISDNTLILYENIGEEYLDIEKKNGWGVIPMLWESTKMLMVMKFNIGLHVSQLFRYLKVKIKMEMKH